MRLIGKLLALPFMLVTGILYLVCKFLVVLSGAVLGILSGIIFLAALVLFFVAGFLPGLAWLMIAFLISPYGLPLAAAWLVGIIGGATASNPLYTLLHRLQNASAPQFSTYIALHKIVSDMVIASSCAIP